MQSHGFDPSLLGVEVGCDLRRPWSLSGGNLQCAPSAGQFLPLGTPEHPDGFPLKAAMTLEKDRIKPSDSQVLQQSTFSPATAPLRFA